MINKTTIKTLVIFLALGTLLSGCSKTTTSTLTINNTEIGDYFIYIYPITSMPTNWSSRPNDTDAIAVGRLSYWASEQNRGEVPKAELNWPEGVLSGDFLVEVSLIMAKGYIVTSFNKGNATVNFNSLTVLNSPSVF